MKETMVEGNDTKLGPNVRGQAKYQRKCTRYLEKKISPIIFSDMLAMLSVAQRNWVTRTGFSELLDFSMETYPHYLGYDIVESFDSLSCSLKINAGFVKISEKVVKNVLGLPNGCKDIVLRRNQDVVVKWVGQFGGKCVSRVTPGMVYQKIRDVEDVTELFKLNFLLMLCNVLIESNLNAYVNPDILDFYGDIDVCKDYNWCKLLIKKLVSTHQYWIEKPSRVFAGSLPFLIYLYIDRVVNGSSIDVLRKQPAYKAWSDALITERQKYEKVNKTFGIGYILQWPDENISNGELVVPTEEKKDDCSLSCQPGKLGIGGGSNDAIMSCVNTSIHSSKEFAEGLRTREQEERVSGQVLLKVSDNKFDGEPLDCANEDEKVRFREEKLDKVVGSSVAKKLPDLWEDQALDDSLNEENLIDYYNELVGQLEGIYNEVHSVHTTTLLLYPENSKIMELKGRVMKIGTHDLYHSQTSEETPLSRKISSPNILVDSQPFLSTQIYVEMDRISAERFKTNSICLHDADIPSFSLGLSQSVPMNLSECGKSINNLDLNVGQKTNVDEFECEEDVVGLRNRPRRDIKLPQNMCSPFVSRVINISTRTITAQEKSIWDWLFMESDNDFETIFEWNDRACTREQLQSLKENEMVMGNVIDCWTYLLNVNEKRKSRYSPLRLFCRIETTYGPLQDPFADDSYTNFTENMDMDTSLSKYLLGRHIGEEEYDMFFFPIHSNSHHYLIVYNVKYPSWEIIDNIAGSEDVLERYGTLPFNLHNYFIRWMRELMMPAWVRMCDLQPVIIDMPWQTVENCVDCGIFLMRHMETYMGFSGSEWDIGLSKESARQKRQLGKFRVIYCCEVLTSMINRKRKEIIDAATSYGKGIFHEVVDDWKNVDIRGQI